MGSWNTSSCYSKLQGKDNPRDAMELVSKTLCIPLNKLKLICKGKVVTEDNLLSTVFDQAQKKFLVRSKILWMLNG